MMRIGVCMLELLIRSSVVAVGYVGLSMTEATKFLANIFYLPGLFIVEN